MKSIGPMQCSREPLQTWKKGNSSNVKSFQCVFRSSDQCQTPIRQMLTQSKSLGLVLFKDCILLKKKEKLHIFIFMNHIWKDFFPTSSRKDQISGPFRRALFFLLNWIVKAAKGKLGGERNLLKGKPWISMNNYYANLLENRDNEEWAEQGSASLALKERLSEDSQGCFYPRVWSSLHVPTLADFTALVSLVLFLNPAFPCSSSFFPFMGIGKEGIVE